TNGTDYQTLSGQVTIAAGSNSAPVLITPIDDTLVEGPEAVTLTLYDGTGALRPDLTATVTINDDDLGPVAQSGGPVRLSVAAVANASPPNPTAVFDITRSGGDLSQPLTVTYTLGGSARPGIDYTAPPGSVTFGPNQTTAAVRIVPISTSASTPPTVTLGGL